MKSYREQEQHPSGRLLLMKQLIDKKRELSAIVIRYAYVKEGKWVCVEDPVAIMDIIQRATAQDVQGELCLTGSVIGSIFLSIVKELGLNLSRCVGQGYDGASVLASDRVGASSKFCSESNHAYYFHCAMHCLNLSAMKTVSVETFTTLLNRL